MDNLDYQNIMKYFPPVNPNIENVYLEADNTYTSYNAVSPLKPISVKGEMYSIDILTNLRTLRNLLNSDIASELFIYELNRLVSAWGHGGIYGENILNSSLLHLINKVNIKQEKQIELMQDAQKIVLEHQMKELEDDIKGISFKHKSNKKLNIKDLDFTKLGLSKNKSITKKSKSNNKK